MVGAQADPTRLPNSSTSKKLSMNHGFRTTPKAKPSFTAKRSDRGSLRTVRERVVNISATVSWRACVSSLAVLSLFAGVGGCGTSLTSDTRRPDGAQSSSQASPAPRKPSPDEPYAYRVIARVEHRQLAHFALAPEAARGTSRSHAAYPAHSHLRPQLEAGPAHPSHIAGRILARSGRRLPMRRRTGKHGSGHDVCPDRGSCPTRHREHHHHAASPRSGYPPVSADRRRGPRRCPRGSGPHARSGRDRPGRRRGLRVARLGCRATRLLRTAAIGHRRLHALPRDHTRSPPPSTPPHLATRGGVGARSIRPRPVGALSRGSPPSGLPRHADVALDSPPWERLRRAGSPSHRSPPARVSRRGR